MQIDYYEILGIAKDANSDEIKRAYRQIALKFHPDRNPDNPEAEKTFKQAAEAYDVLRDPDKKSKYDRFGHAGLRNNGFTHFTSNSDIFSHFSDIFGDFFGGMSSGSRGPYPQVGENLRYRLKISFADAAKGTEVKINVSRSEPCANCEATGAAEPGAIQSCGQCNGSGKVTQRQSFFHVSMPCPNCRGAGQIISKPCPKCSGIGQIEVARELAVRIPAGIDTGNRLRLRGEGELGLYGGPPGDLFVEVYVEEDKRFKRDGQDLYVSKEISFVQAALGDKIEVETLDGVEQLEIPKGVQSSTLFKMSGLGLPYPNSKRVGDMYIEFMVKTPTSISKKQEELLREFEKLNQEKPLTKVKEMFKKAGKVIGMD